MSGGQRQRIALARALVSEPEVLLLDEATCHLDVETEASINEALASIACTRIIVTHRIDIARKADTITVMRNGEIVERGKHADLISAGGAYLRMVSQQQS